MADASAMRYSMEKKVDMVLAALETGGYIQIDMQLCSSGCSGWLVSAHSLFARVLSRKVLQNWVRPS